MTPPEPKCAACPLRHLKADCAARTLPHPAFCDRAAEGRAFDAVIAKLSGVPAENLPPAEAPVALPAPPAVFADPSKLGAARRRFLLTQTLAPGDWVAMTALVRDLKLAYGDRVEVDVQTPYSELFAGNPHLTRGLDLEVIKPMYGGGIAAQKTEVVHFLAWYHRNFEHQTGIPVPVRFPHPDLHLSRAERETRILGDRRYWVFVAGGKQDVTAKWWRQADWQAACNLARAAGVTIVQAGGVAKDHWHPPIDGAVNLVGKTDLRAFMRLIDQSDGVVCGVTAAMHIAAGLHKPCVVLAGGREAWWWEAYVNENRGFGPDASGRVPVPHRFLHTIGLLDCCPTHGCWRTHVDTPPPGKRQCKYPERGDGPPIARCMTMIRPTHVLEAMMSYYEDNALPPIGDAPPPPVRLFPPAEAPTAPVDLSAPAGSPTFMSASLPPGSAVFAAPPPAAIAVPDRPIYDDPAIGGRFTLFVFLRGDHRAMQERCLDTLRQTLPAGRAAVRAIAAGVGGPVRDLLARMEAERVVSRVYDEAASVKKYAAMRAAFRDTACPIETKYVIWADDDTYFDQHPNWLSELAHAVAAGHPDGDRLYGPHKLWQLKPGQVDWIRSAPWFRGLPFRDARGASAAGGLWIHCADGRFFALAAEAIRAQDIPDRRLGQDGDYVLGEQVNQGSWGLRKFSTQRQFVNWGAEPRRAGPEAVVGGR